MPDEELEKKIEEFDKKAIHYLFTVFWSMVTAMLVTIALTR